FLAQLCSSTFLLNSLDWRSQLMFKEFKEFAMRGNVVDMAVGVIIGAAFGQIVTSLVQDILMPPIGKLLGHMDFSNLFVALNGASYATIAQAKAAGVATINYGIFINTIINFIIVAFAVFLLIRQINRLSPKPAPTAATTRECPFCLSTIPLNAKKCAHCTSQLS